MKASLLALFFGFVAANGQISEPERGDAAFPAKADPDAVPVPGVIVPPGWHIHWELQGVTLPTKVAQPMLAELRDETTVAAGWAKLQGMVTKGVAAVTLDTGGKALPEGQVVFFQGEEVTYPISSDGPEVVNPTKHGVAPQPEDLKPGKPQLVAYAPNTFEKRKVGIALTFTTTPSEDGKRLRVTSGLERNWLVKWEEIEVGRLANNEKILFKQPRFAAVQIHHTVGMNAGERLLLSAHPVAGDAEKSELLFLRVWTSVRKEAETK